MDNYLPVLIEAWKGQKKKQNKEVSTDKNTDQQIFLS